MPRTEVWKEMESKWSGHLAREARQIQHSQVCDLNITTCICPKSSQASFNFLGLPLVTTSSWWTWDNIITSRPLETLKLLTKKIAEGKRRVLLHRRNGLYFILFQPDVAAWLWGLFASVWSCFPHILRCCEWYFLRFAAGSVFMNIALLKPWNLSCCILIAAILALPALALSRIHWASHHPQLFADGKGSHIMRQ